MYTHNHNNFFFFLLYIRMSGKNINFNDQKISRKAAFTNVKR